LASRKQLQADRSVKTFDVCRGHLVAMPDKEAITPGNVGIMYFKDMSADKASCY
jgi:hypothetical protein